MLLRFVFLLVLAGLWLPGRCQAQFTSNSASGNLPGEQRLVPPAPTTASLGSYGSLPVDLNAGVVSLSVPLGEATCRSLTVPVSLSYRTTGIRVEEVASWVGLGWSLNASGLVTRTVRGQPDETPNSGYFEAYPRWLRADSVYRANPTPANRNAKKLADYEAANGLIDTEPDTYSLALPGGQSATVVFDVHRRVHLNPARQWVVNGGPDGGWEVVLPDGVRYQFDATETTQPATGGATDPPFASAWHLTAIVSASGHDRIDFEYVNNTGGFAQVVPVNRVFRAKLYAVPYNPYNTSASYCAQDPPFSDGNVVTATNYSTLSLRRIRAATLTVDFNSDTVRPDLSPTTDAPGRRLTSVVFTDARFPAAARRFELTYAATASRLRLDAVRQVGQPGYVFQYNEATSLPARSSYAQDHWGFYNAQANGSLVPAPPASIANGRVVNAIATANRAANPQAMQAGVLTAVQYPTGGRSFFAYEANSGWETPAGADDSVSIFSASVSGLAPHHLDSVSQAVYDVLFPPYSIIGQPSVAARVFTVPLGATNLVVNTVPNSGSSGAQYGLYRLNSPQADPGSFQSGTQIYPAPPTGGAIILASSLAPGTYVVYASALDVNDFATIELRMHVTTAATGRDRAVGGLRIRRMVDYAGTGDSIVSLYDYTRYDSTAHRRISTGVLFFEPQYIRFSPCGAAIIAAADARTMSYAQEGYHIGYNEVRVTRRGAADGSTTYRYLNSSEANSRSLVMSETVTDGANRVVKQVDNGYCDQPVEGMPLRKVYLNNYVVGRCGQLGCTDYYVILDEAYETEYGTYQCFPEMLLSRSREQRLVAPSGNGAPPVDHELVRTYAYARLPSGQLFASPSWVRQLINSGEQVAIHTTYAREYDAVNAADVPTAGLAQLAAHHVLTAAVETQRWRHHGNDSVLVGGGLTHYQDLQPRNSWTLETAVPVAPTSFTSSRITNQRFVQDARFVETASYDQYDQWGNVLEEHTKTKYSSFIWDGLGTNLLASITKAHIRQVAFTSFEPNATGRWQYDSLNVGNHYVPAHVTGTQGYQLDGTSSGALRRPGLAAGEYELWFWSHGANAPLVSGAAQLRDEIVSVAGPWHQHRVRLTLPANAMIQINSAPNQLIWIDEVRLHPMGAQMTTYTHRPQVGLTSQTDPGGRTVTYEYDALGRLQRARDEQGRVLTEQQYHYARP